MTKRNRTQPLKRKTPAAGAVQTTPPKRVGMMTVYRTLGENMVYGPGTHAMQVLPNGQTLLLFEDDESATTIVLGEEAVGFCVRPPKENTDALGEAGEG